ncbi:glycosyltransferase family 2 protein [Flavihumibacter petaseus]|uniref:Putative glycosyltransferase n=1 Tax=Flavihumibacter petaseus NBRC 106054 TaxID=1220578 RepID=A0A0E9MVT5_9BACT|nr:glycosyltransferase family 2 protein [Flavihumibacter petaseus]GAO41699.1 putative glycosyltransferase [Flavihumibacter petaseus NBRC 106054]
MKSSLIISTYNRPDALEVSLLSAIDQTVLPDEIIVADDGSTAETAATVAAFAKQSKVPVKHIWQEDTGFRLSRIRNLAIAAASGDYIIQIDGDIVLHPRFIEDHLKFARPRTFVRASRIYLNDELTDTVIRTKKTRINIFNKGVTNTLSAIRFPLIWPLFETSYKNKGDERWEIHGCNMAFWKEDIVSVNGYNEAFSGWGMEDKELVVRLINAGFEKRFLKAGGVAFHLIHPVNAKERLQENERLLKEAIDARTAWCENGVSQHFESPESETTQQDYQH